MKTRPTVPPYWVPLLVVLMSVASGLSARAQLPAAPATPASCDADEQCAQLANEAREHSQAGRFDKAQGAYEAAYAKQPDAKLLFNLARVLHKAGRFAPAVAYYQKYLDAGAEGSEEQRLKAQQRLDEARREQASASVVTPPRPHEQPVQLLQPGATPAPLESSRSAPLYRKWWLWTVVGVAAAGVAVGVGLGVASRRPDLTGTADARPFGG